MQAYIAERAGKARAGYIYNTDAGHCRYRAGKKYKMKRISRTILVPIAALVFAFASWQSVHASAPKHSSKRANSIAWTESLDSALKTAGKTKKPIFIDFYADWCGPCQEMLRTTYRDKEVVARSRRFVPVLINVDKQPKLAQKYQVDSIPTVVFLNAKGEFIGGSVGYHDVPEFLKLTDAALKKAAQ